jgi:hypothetical protein
MKVEYKQESKNNLFYSSNSNSNVTSILDIKNLEEDEMYSDIFSKNQKDQLNNHHQITEEHDEDEEDINIFNIVNKTFNNKQNINTLINLPKRIKNKFNIDNVNSGIIHRKSPVIINEIKIVKKTNRLDNVIKNNDLSNKSKKQKVIDRSSSFIPTNDINSDIEDETFSKINSNNLKKRNYLNIGNDNSNLKINSSQGVMIDLTLSDDDANADDLIQEVSNNNNNINNVKISNTIKIINSFSSLPQSKLATIFANNSSRNPSTETNKTNKSNNYKKINALSPETKRANKEQKNIQQIKLAYENIPELDKLIINNKNPPRSDNELYMIPSLVIKSMII